MRTLLLFGTLVTLACGCWCPPRAFAAEPAEANSVTNSVVPGADLAHAISEVTGVAISPLVGVSLTFATGPVFQEFSAPGFRISEESQRSDG